MSNPSHFGPGRNAPFGAGPPTLVVVAGPQVGRVVTVLGEVVIGRAKSAELSIDDSTISRRHARVFPTSQGYYVFEDLGSKNGSRINGSPTKRARLEAGDEIRIGSHIVLNFAPSETSEDQAAHRRRLEAVGRVGTGVAHDLNNMLGAILASVDFLAQIPCECKDSEQAEEVKSCLSDIRIALVHAGELTQGIMRFVRGKSRQHELVDISNLCVEVLHLLRHTFDSSICIEQQIIPGQTILGDPAELHLVLMNLCLNARDAMPQGGTLLVKVAAANSTSKVLLDVPTVQVVITDTGIGMDESTRAQIFEPFFTTKPQGVGFGIGLATTLQVIEAHGGKVDVISAPNTGTTFRLFFPLMHESERVIEVHEERDSSPKLLGDSGATLLLADDEDVVRRSVSRLLRHAGYHVLEVSDGEQAIEAFMASHPRPDLTILDLDMPKLSGLQTQRMIHNIDPGARLLFLSGHDYGTHPECDALPDHVGYLRKPCDGKLLLTTISRLIASTPFLSDSEEHTVTE